MPGKKFHILITPLDWGIGHATRCVPIIRMLLQKGIHVSIAGTGPSLAFLRLTFPELNVIHSGGFKVTYPGKGSMAFKMALSTPGFLAGIYREHHWLEKTIRQYGFDAVISDNRFGCWSHLVPSIYITHQVMIKMPKGMEWMEPLFYRAHRLFIEKYSMCWIPDAAGDTNLSGDLSHRFSLPGNTRFIGPLSRFADFRHTPLKQDQKTDIDLLVMLSGPEPQRSILERIITRAIAARPGTRAVVLQGKPGKTSLLEQNNGMTIYSHLPDHEIFQMVRRSGRILCRSGYSTIMDLASMNRPAILVPTPGQTEQIYLGEYLSTKKWFRCVPQATLTVDKIFEGEAPEAGQLPDMSSAGSLEAAIGQLLESLG